MALLIRDFTDETKSRLEKQIKEIEDQDPNWYNHVGDFFEDLWNGIVGVNIDSYANNIAAYHKQIMDTKNTTVDQLRKIFKDVDAVDSSYCAKLKDANTRFDYLGRTMKALADTLNPGCNAGAVPFTSNNFYLKLSKAGSGIVDFYLNEMTSTGPDGKLQYKWSKIEEMLGKKPEDMTAAEYTALLDIIDSMSTVDSNGNVVADTDALTRFIECGYSCELESFVSSDFVTTTLQYNYSATPAFQTVCALYQLKVDRLMQQNGATFYNGDEDSATRQYLCSEMFKSSLLMEMAFTCPKITQYQDMKTITDTNMKTLSIHIVRDEANKCYKVDADGFLNDYVGGITIFDFNTNNQRRLHYNEAHIANSLYRDKGSEFLEALGDEAVGFIIDRGIDAAKLSGWVGVPLEINKFAIDTAMRNVEIDMNNKKIDEQLRDMNLEEAFDAMKVGGSVTVYHDTVSFHNTYINERELQIALNAYNNKTGQNVSLSNLEAGFDGVVKDGKGSPTVQGYVNWYGDNDMAMNDYRASLDRELRKYYEKNPDSPFYSIYDLSVDQINELDKKLDDPNYDLDLESLK